MSKYVIWDLDNCLANDEHRIHLIDWSTKDATQRFAAYHAACHEDPPGNLARFNESLRGGLMPLFITGRPCNVRFKTQKWIVRNLSYRAADDQLLMRWEGCELPSAELKEKLLERFLKEMEPNFLPADLIANAYDDHEPILRMYRTKFGIHTTALRIHSLDAYSGEYTLDRKDHPVQPAPVEELGPVRPQPLRVGVDFGEGGPPSDHAADALGFAVRTIYDERARLNPVRESADKILERMAATFRERNGQYRDNSKMVPQLVSAMFPNGVPPELVVREEWHLFELILVKLTRFATSELSHVDSIHDVAPYCAMIEAIITERNRKQ